MQTIVTLMFWLIFAAPVWLIFAGPFVWDLWTVRDHPLTTWMLPHLLSALAVAAVTYWAVQFERRRREDAA